MSKHSENQAQATREIWYANGETRLFAVEQGAGKPLVFLHGGMADHRAALAAVGQLGAACRLVTPDVRGAGRSVFRGELSWDVHAADVACLLDALGIDRAFVGGSSAGSAIALHFARRYGDRVRGLALVAPVYRGTALGLTQAQVDAMQRMHLFAQRAVEDGIEALYPLYDALPAPLRERAVRMASDFDPESVAASTRFFAAGAQPFEHLDQLAAITARTLVVPGTDPEHPPEVAALYAQHLPNHELAPAGLEPHRAITRLLGAELASHSAQAGRTGGS